MEIKNLKTLSVHSVDEILNVDGVKIYFTEDGLCIPQSEVEEILTSEQKPKLSDAEIDKILKSWAEKVLGTEEQFLNRQELGKKNTLGYIKKPKLLNKFLEKFFKKRLYIEDNSVIESKSKILYRKITLFTFNKKEYYLLSK